MKYELITGAMGQEMTFSLKSHRYKTISKMVL